VNATNSDGTGTGTGIFSYVAGPAINSVSPPTGATLGGSVAVIAGSGLSGATAVTFGGVAATIVANPDDYTIIVHAPPHAAGLIDVSVTAASVTNTLAAAFTYDVPVSPARNLYLFDDCCHNWFSSDTGNTWREGATPGGPSTPPPDDPGQDPYGVGTLLDEWADAQMAINDGDYLTICGFDNDYNGAFGILGLSLVAGQNKTYKMIDWEPGSPAFVANFALAVPGFSGAISAKGQIILALPNNTGNDGSYPRISRDGGATWSDVSSVPIDPINFGRNIFSKALTVESPGRN
jgi:hypothetical protein